MALLPVLLEMVDDIYSSLDNQSKNADSIPLLFMPQRPGGCGQGMRFHCGPKAASGTRKCQRGACTMATKPEGFKVVVDVKSFKPEEVNVKVKGHEIIVEGKHEEREDEIGFVSRQFSRRFVLPQEYDPDTVSTFLDAEGKMTINAQKPQPPAVETNERKIPIQRVASAASEEAPTTEQDWEKVEQTAGETSKKTEEEKLKE